MCGKDHIAIRAAEAFFEYHGVPLESLHLPNKSCGAKREHIDGVPYYVFRVSKHKYVTCGGLPFEVQLEHNSFNVCASLEKDERLNVFFYCPLTEKCNSHLVFPECEVRPSGYWKHH